MKRIKVIINYAGLSTPHLIEFSRNVAGKMATNESTFPSPDIAVTALITLINTVEARYNAAQKGGRQQKLELDEARKSLLDALRIEALYVEKIANGNEITIVSSGFENTHQPQTVNHPEFSVENTGSEGTVILKHKAVEGAKAWVWQQCSDPLSDNAWEQIAITTKTFITVEGLTPCTRYWFRVSYVNKYGQSDWTAPQMIIVT